MAIITPSFSIAFARFAFGQKRFDLTEASESTGAANIRVLGPPRWRVSCESPRQCGPAQIAIWQPLLMNLRGRVNHLALWDHGQSVPLGTMRGTLTVSGTPAAGAVTMSVTGGAGQASTTLKANDWLQIGTGLTSQLINITADATANGSGVIAITFEPPLRTSFSNGTAVTWDHPVAHYKMVNEAPMFEYDPGYLLKGGIALDLLEQWS